MYNTLKIVRNYCPLCDTPSL